MDGVKRREVSKRLSPKVSSPVGVGSRGERGGWSLESQLCRDKSPQVKTGRRKACFLLLSSLEKDSDGRAVQGLGRKYRYLLSIPPALAQIGSSG